MTEVNPNVSNVATQPLLGSAARKLLASDLDGTLIPPVDVDGDGGISELRGAVEALADLAVAYVTGRSHAQALAGISGHGLPPPEVLVCDVGTSVFVACEGGYVPDPDYRDLMLEALGGVDAASARPLLAELAGLELQADEHQTELKLSYYTPADARGEELAARARELLEDVGRFNVVHSVDPLSRRGLLDVLPRGVAKDFAVRYLHDRSGVDEEALVYAGDSGNDVAAMLSGFQVVVVGNAEPSLKARLAERASERRIAERVYFAEASYAAGVLEGCRRFRLV